MPPAGGIHAHIKIRGKPRGPSPTDREKYISVLCPTRCSAWRNVSGTDIAFAPRHYLSRRQYHMRRASPGSYLLRCLSPNSCSASPLRAAVQHPTSKAAAHYAIRRTECRVRGGDTATCRRDLRRRMSLVSEPIRPRDIYNYIYYQNVTCLCLKWMQSLILK